MARSLRCCILALLAALGACTSAREAPTVLPAHRSLQPRASYPIEHVVIVVQENRSFENFFAGYPHADAPMQGKIHTGASVALQPITFGAVNLNHYYRDSQIEWDGGKNDQFDFTPPTSVHQPLGHRPIEQFAYSYVQRSLVAPYWSMARQYTLADHMFSTVWGPSFTAHQALVAGTTAISGTASVIDLPHLPNNGTTTWKCDAVPGTVTNLLTSAKHVELDAGPFPCFTYPTIADALDARGVSWIYYDSLNPKGTGQLWNAFGAIKKIYRGPDWSKITNAKNQILTDAQAGNLPSVSWVIPDALNSDHPGDGSDTGPSWVAQVVNAIGTGPQWNSTAIIVVWDEWGGWYDNVAPPQLDYAGLAFRVPCLIISPYARKGYVAHTRYEFGSILKTVEKLFGLKPIGGQADDVRSNDMLDSFNFKAKPAPFTPIAAKYSRDFFMNQPASGLPVDDE